MAEILRLAQVTFARGVILNEVKNLDQDVLTIVLSTRPSLATNSNSAVMNLKDPVVQTYVIAALLMGLKMMLQAWITVYRMIKVNGGFLHAEDIKKTPFNPNPSPDQLKPDPDVERSRSIQRNDMENIPIFLVIGFLFTLTQPALWAAQTLMYGYVASRLLHSYALGTAKTHDLRAVFFTIGSLIIIGMGLYTLVFVLRG